VFANWAAMQRPKGWRANSNHKLTDTEKREIDRAIEQATTDAAKAQAEVWAEAAVKARGMWSHADKAPDHYDYCQRKDVRPHGLHVYRFKGGDQMLFVPMRDEKDKIQSLQFIHPYGTKRFLGGSRVANSHFWVCHPKDADDPNTICICEGWATGETIYDATGFAVVIAFYAMNLLAVAKWVREQYPQAKFVLCADDDWKRKDNPGRAKAVMAARAVNGVVAMPMFEGERRDRDTDFNDMARLSGLDAVEDTIKQATVPVKPNAENNDERGGETDDDENENQTQTDTLVRSAAGVDLFHTDDNAAFADIQVNDHRETWAVKSKAFELWLRQAYYKATNSAPNPTA
jgi:putative DNA primase/helicase